MPSTAYADATDARHIAGTHGGLTDTYASYMMPIFCGIKWTNAVHIFLRRRGR